MPTNTNTPPHVRTVVTAKIVQQMSRDLIVDIQRAELAGLSDLRLRDDIARSLFKNRYPAIHAAMVQSVAVYGWLL
jgi:hypothetical protein